MNSNARILDALDGRRRLTWTQQPLCWAILESVKSDADRLALAHRKRHPGCTVRTKTVWNHALGATFRTYAVVARVKQDYAD